MADTCVELGARRARRGRAGRRASAISNQRGSTIVWDRATGEPVGPGLGWQDLRTVGACLALRADGVRLGPNQSATKLQWLLDAARPTAARAASCASARSTRGSRGRCRAARVHVTDATNAAVTGLQVPRRVGEWDDAALGDARHPDAAMLPEIVDSCRRRSARRGALAGRAADRRARRRPAGVARRPGMRAARRRQDHVRHRRHARRRPRRAAARFGRRAAAHGTFPIVAWRARRARDVGQRGDHARGGHERAVAARRPRHHRELRRVGTMSRPSVPTAAASCSCPRRSGSARPRGTTARAARSSD